MVRLNDRPDMTIVVYFGHKKREQYFWGEKVLKIGMLYKLQGPVVQSIVSLTSSLRGQLVKCFRTLSPKTLIFFVEKIREAFAASHIFSTKNIGKF